MRLSRRQLLVGLVVLLLVPLIAAGGLLVVEALNPRVSMAQAAAAAVTQLRQMNPSVGGWDLVASRYDLMPDKVFDDNGNLISSESRSSCILLGVVHGPSWACHAEPAWILHFRAPAPNGVSIDAYVVVNANSGKVGSASVNEIARSS